ncbi:MAG TPA: TonB-dependent receptor [Steroidobacteraceae bacterium]|nr:TonB-dependent receptor [Steroidobacteraceae bacterium]
MASSSRHRCFLGTPAARLVLVSACIGASPVIAQTDQAAAPTADQGGLQEVIVTAEKRDTSAQKTPIAMSVLSSEAIASNGAANLEDVTSMAPSVSFSKSDAASIVTIRGVSSRDTTEIGDPAVAVSVDGFYYQRAIGMSDSMFDLERVEVLRGPQGTLYGRNATGGAINIITAKPTKELEGYGSVSYGNYNAVTAEGALNIPLNDWIQLRTAFFSREHDGYRDNAPARAGDDEDAKAARVHLMMEPTDNLTALFTAQLVKLGGVGPAVYGYPLQYDTSGNILHSRPPMPSDPTAWPMSEPSGYMDTTSKSVQWKFDYDTTFAKFTYFGGLRQLQYHSLLNLDGVAPPEAYYFQANEQPRTWNHEFRISSKENERYTWQIGAFYFQETNDLLTYFQDYNVPTPPTNLYIFSYPDLNATSKAGFGQGSYSLTDTVKIEAGIRYTSDYKRRTGSLNYGTGIEDEDASAKSSKTTYHGGVDWQVTPGSMLYAKIDTGYKAGGFTDVAPYAPESITAYEIGSKSRFLGNTLQLNTAAFFYDYTDQQISQFVNGRTIIDNAGKSQIFGVEFDTAYLLTDADKVDAYVGYLHAQFKEFELANGNANLDLAGNAPPQSPRLSLNVGYQHRFQMPNGAGLTARVQTHFETSSNLTVYNYADDRQSAYSRTDAMLTYSPADGKWSIEAFGKNLENRLIIINAEENGLWGDYNYQFADPRTYGVRATVHF